MVFFPKFLKKIICGSMSCSSLGNNDLSGTLPPELGNLVELGEL